MANDEEVYDEGRIEALLGMLRALASRIHELDRSELLLSSVPELLRRMGDLRSELFHYEVRSTYDSPEVAEHRRLVDEARTMPSFRGLTHLIPRTTNHGGARPGLNRFYLVLGAVALAGIAWLVYQVGKPSGVSIPVNVTVLAADTAGFRGYLLGNPAAPVEVSEFADYQCPACGQFEAVQFPAVQQQLIATGMARWRYRDFPLDMHPHARLASHAGACANEQNKFWELKQVIYERQSEWSPVRNAAAKFSDYAKEVGLDVNRYDECMKSAKFAGRIQASVDEGTKLGVTGTPTFLIGGRLYPWVSGLGSDSIRALVRALLPKPTQ